MKKQFYLGCLEDSVSMQLAGHLFPSDGARFDKLAGAIDDLVVGSLLTQADSDRIRKRLVAKIRAAVDQYHRFDEFRPDVRAERKGARK
jgi:hypothetical protein